LATSILQTNRFRIVFGIWWCSLAEVHATILSHFNFSWRTAFVDSIVSNGLLAAIALLVSITLQYYNPRKNRYVYVAALVIILTIVYTGVSKLLLSLLLNDVPGYNNMLSLSLVIRGAFGLLVTGCMALISVLYYTIQDQQEIDRRNSEAAALSKEAELSRLRQQLQPHFLFNSLNSINALIVVKPQQARTMIQQLSDFLRGTLKKEENQWIPIDEELQHLQLYLDIEKVRFGHRLCTQVENKTTDALVPAMLLQPVVENAIKFGLYDTTEDVTISIETWKEDGYLFIQVTNPFDAGTSVPQQGTGFGLRSIQRRLYLLFARNDLVQTQTHDHIFTTLIKIPQQS
jgi:two-component system, LytTR family, sensor kinase